MRWLRRRDVSSVGGGVYIRFEERSKRKRRSETDRARRSREVMSERARFVGFVAQSHRARDRGEGETNKRTNRKRQPTLACVIRW